MSRFIKAVEGMGHSVIYTDDSGKHFRFYGGTWAWRNHNPGNVSPCIGDGWISKEQCIELAKNGLVDLEICISILGNIYLRVPASSLFQKKLGDLIEGNK